MNELEATLNLMKGQKLIGVCREPDGSWQLHFTDWVLFIKEPYPTPIIGRIGWSEVKTDR